MAQNLSNSNDTTGLPSIWSMSGTEFIASLVVLGVLVILGIVGNAIVVGVIGTSRRHGQRANVQLFLFHLALSDLMVSFVCIPLTIMINFFYTKERSVVDQALCKVARFTQFLAPASSICILTVISVDRYFSLVRPLRVKKFYMKPKFLIGGAWIYSALIFLPTFYFAMPALISTSEGDFFYCITIPNNTPAGSAYLIFLFIMGFAVPFITMVILYYRIGRSVWRRERKISRSATATITPAHAQLMEKSKKRVTRMLLIVVVVFLCCWAPFVVYTGFIERWVASFPNPADTARFVTYCFGLFNSICNPFIYYFSSEDLRKESWKYICIEGPVGRAGTLRSLVFSNHSPILDRIKKISRDMSGKGVQGAELGGGDVQERRQGQEQGTKPLQQAQLQQQGQVQQPQEQEHQQQQEQQQQQQQQLHEEQEQEQQQQQQSQLQEESDRHWQSDQEDLDIFDTRL